MRSTVKETPSMSKPLRGYEPPQLVQEHSGPTASFAYRDINVSTEGDRGYLDTVTTISRYTARNHWRWYDEIGEVHYGISRTAKVAGYARLLPQRVNMVGVVTDTKDEGTVAEIVAGIYGKFGGLRGLIERYFTLMKITGEGYLIRVVEGGVADGYWILSPDEIQGTTLPGGKIDTTKPIKWITAITTGRGEEASQFVREIQPEDFLGRIWNPSKRWVDMVDSPMSALSGQCEMLKTLTDGIMGRLRSRFALAGILLIPSEINDANIAGARPGEEHSDKVLSYLITLMTRNVMNHEDATAFIPALLKGPAVALEAVRHVILDTLLAETDIKLRGELIDRILDGLDVQKSQVKGGEGQNHWGSWSSAEDERRIAVQPDLEALMNALTRAILHKELQKRDWVAGKIAPWRVGFDLSEAAVKTNQAEDFRLGWDRGWLSAEAGRRTIGAKDSDKMGDEEYVRWVGRQLSDPYLATYGIDGKNGIKIDFDKVAVTQPKPGPDGEAGKSSGKVGPGTGSPGSPSGGDSDKGRSKRPG